MSRCKKIREEPTYNTDYSLHAKEGDEEGTNQMDFN